MHLPQYAKGSFVPEHALGRILRISSADGIPALINVVRGQATMFGARTISARTWMRQHGLQPSRAETEWDERPGLVSAGWLMLSAEEHTSLPPELLESKIAEKESEYLNNWTIWREIGLVYRLFAVTLA
jgi:lipopolysaccharide/colanic/teichoic acid biosynthesis glycosyltransferase